MKNSRLCLLFSILLITSMTIGCTQKNNALNISASATETTAPVQISPTPTAWWVDENIPYPTSAEGFILNAGGSDELARQRIIDLGAGEDLKDLESMYTQELQRTGKSPANYKFETMVWENKGKVYWDSVVKDSSGHYLGMKLTKGPEAGQVVRAFGLTRYIMEYPQGEDFFDFFTLQNPPEFPDAVQQMVWDDSGWHVVGLFTQGGTNVGWFNADAPGGGEWRIKESLNPALYKVVDGKIQEMTNGSWKEVQTPPEVGAITAIELHEGKMYGIDTMERAMVVKNDSGEWVKYERPIVGLSSQYSDGYFNINFEMDNGNLLQEINSSGIERMVDVDGQKLDWGYQKGSFSAIGLGLKEDDPLPLETGYFANFTGRFIGTGLGKIEGFDINPKFVVFEIPLKYERQILIFWVDATAEEYPVHLVGQGRDTGDIMVVQGEELYQMVLNNVKIIQGKQAMIQLIFYTYTREGSTACANDIINFWANIVKNKSYDLNSLLLIPLQFWLDKSVSN
jgi:hypothetical protein